MIHVPSSEEETHSMLFVRIFIHVTTPDGMFLLESGNDERQHFREPRHLHYKNEISNPRPARNR